MVRLSRPRGLVGGASAPTPGSAIGITDERRVELRAGFARASPAARSATNRRSFCPRRAPSDDGPPPAQGDRRRVVGGGRVDRGVQGVLQLTTGAGVLEPLAVKPNTVVPLPGIVPLYGALRTEMVPVFPLRTPFQRLVMVCPLASVERHVPAVDRGGSVVADRHLGLEPTRPRVDQPVAGAARAGRSGRRRGGRRPRCGGRGRRGRWWWAAAMWWSSWAWSWSWWWSSAVSC